MRADHLTAADTHAYAERRLPTDEALEISDHLIKCAECRALVRQAERFRALRSDRSEVTYEELAAVVDDELDPLGRREVMDKIAESPRARAELDDLREFRHAVAASSHVDSTTRRPWLRVWALPLAAAIVAGVAFLWSSMISQPREGVLVLRDNGARLQIMPDGSVLGLRDFPAELRASVKNALTQNRIEVPPVVASLGGHAGNLAGGNSSGSTFRAVAPVRVVVEEATPTFEWTPDDRATGYRITIATTDGSDVAEAADVRRGQSRWSPSKPLPAGKSYEWQVQALSGGSVVATAPSPPQPEARFQIMSADARAALERTRARVGGSHLALAFAYARAGVIDKADAELAALQRENSNSDVPSKLRAALRSAASTASTD
jgi:anti-sigma factor RsiW